MVGGKRLLGIRQKDPPNSNGTKAALTLNMQTNEITLTDSDDELVTITLPADAWTDISEEINARAASILRGPEADEDCLADFAL